VNGPDALDERRDPLTPPRGPLHVMSATVMRTARSAERTSRLAASDRLDSFCQVRDVLDAPSTTGQAR
jgi:hypothetical protein